MAESKLKPEQIKSEFVKAVENELGTPSFHWGMSDPREILAAVLNAYCRDFRTSLVQTGEENESV